MDCNIIEVDPLVKVANISSTLISPPLQYDLSLVYLSYKTYQEKYKTGMSIRS